ncbi:uncharacterized protein N7479_001554 [Penicillium vulpinum]|uniref:Uncharacterized protein n=1 Tax=Penicillium vulpinum TaxID=29845 RepID=A0A1V6RUR7_9EURO|nr:uncharacterized protein N7479_001554 [Penicillium vulpinum]KAJ5971636.1 hypothetical protein N7479_001554 [Penicillium vulpinum]OQE05517.1 hypothetical protein PENVUL_c024G01489 [Penicillium vulpinum]
MKELIRATRVQADNASEKTGEDGKNAEGDEMSRKRNWELYKAPKSLSSAFSLRNYKDELM